MHRLLGRLSNPFERLNITGDAEALLALVTQVLFVLLLPFLLLPLDQRALVL